MRNLLILLLLTISSLSLAHYEALYTPNGNEELDYSKPTAILMIGLGKSLSNLPFEAAYLKAQKIHALYPDRQIVFIRAYDLYATDYFKRVLKSKFNVFYEQKRPINNQDVNERLLKFEKIAEFHYFSHSNPWHLNFEKGEKENNWGLVNSEEMAPFADNFEELKNHFTKDAYATINGCNSGYYLAPYLSKTWNIPVTAAISGTDFQRQHVGAEFHSQIPTMKPSSRLLRTFEVLPGQTVTCMEGYGACTRMKPATTSYAGYWGVFLTHLPFFKTFCNFNDKAKCLKNSALSLLASPSPIPLGLNPKRRDYEKAVVEYLCPNFKKTEDSQECMENLRLAAIYNRPFNPLPSQIQVDCNLKGCNFEKIQCRWGLKTGRAHGHSCKVEFDREEQEESMTIVREYLFLMDAFNYL